MQQLFAPMAEDSILAVNVKQKADPLVYQPDFGALQNFTLPELLFIATSIMISYLCSQLCCPRPPFHFYLCIRLCDCALNRSIHPLNPINMGDIYNHQKNL